MMCFKHGVRMPVTKDDGRHAPLHRCPVCTDEFRKAFAKAMRKRQRHMPTLKQHTLPPVIMPGSRRS
jgi:hypothetical protein